MTEPISTQEALGSIIESLKTIAEALGPIADLAECLDVAMQRIPDDKPLNAISFLRSYRQVSREMEAGGDGEESA